MADDGTIVFHLQMTVSSLSAALASQSATLAAVQSELAALRSEVEANSAIIDGRLEALAENLAVAKDTAAVHSETNSEALTVLKENFAIAVNDIRAAFYQLELARLHRENGLKDQEGDQLRSFVERLANLGKLVGQA